MPHQNSVVIAGMGLFHSGAAGAIQISAADTPELLPGINVRSVDRQSIFAGIAVRKALAAYLERGSLNPDQTGVVMGSTFGAITSIGSFYRQALREGVNSVSPMEFPNTVANAPASRVGIWFKLKGPNVTLSDGLVSGLNAVGYAFDEIHCQRAEFYVAGDTEEISDNLLQGYTKTFRQCPEGFKQVAEVSGEGAGGLFLSSRQAALAANYQIYAEIAGFYSGASPLTDRSRRIFAAVEALLAENGMRPEETVIYSSVQPFNPAAEFLIEEVEQRFGSARLVTPNCEGDQSFQYFALNGIIDVVRAATDLTEARYQQQGAVIVETDWDGRFAAMLLKRF